MIQLQMETHICLLIVTPPLLNGARKALSARRSPVASCPVARRGGGGPRLRGVQARRGVAGQVVHQHDAVVAVQHPVAPPLREQLEQSTSLDSEYRSRQVEYDTLPERTAVQAATGDCLAVVRPTAGRAFEGQLCHICHHLGFRSWCIS